MSEDEPRSSERPADTLVRTSERVSDSSQKLASSTEKIKGAADRSTQLAADRTVLAAERTYAAWIRTGLASLASGVGAKKVLEGVVPEWLIIATGSWLVLFSALCFAVAVWRDLFPGVTAPDPQVRRLPAPVLIIANGVLVLVALAALIGIWLGPTGGN